MVQLDHDAVLALGGGIKLGVVDDLGTGLGGDLHIFLADLDGHGTQIADLGEIGVADGAIGLLHGGDHARGALGALTDLVRPVLAQLIRPSVRHGVDEVADEVLGGAGLVGAVHHGDRGGRQFEIRVLVLDGRIVPSGDLAVEDLGDRLGVHVHVLALVRDTLQVEHHGDRGDVNRDIERGAAGAHALGLLDLVGAQRGVGAGPRGGTGQEGAHARAGAGRIIADLGIRIGALEAGDPGLNGGLLRRGARTLELAGDSLGRGGVGVARVVAGRGGGVVAAGGQGGQHGHAGEHGDGTGQKILAHDGFPSYQILACGPRPRRLFLHGTIQPMGVWECR